MVKVPGHPTAQGLREGRVTLEDLYGNILADTLASRGADSHAPSPLEATRLKEIDDKTLQVRRRLVAIAMACAALKTPEQYGPPKYRNRTERDQSILKRKKYKRKQALEQEGHTLEPLMKKHWRCAVCRQARPE